MPMIAYETAVWERLGRLYCSQTGRSVLLKWDSDENVLTVKFAHVSREADCCIDPYSTSRWIAKNGIIVGLRSYQFFAFKDGGKEEKKKYFSTKGATCYFIRTDSTASNDKKNFYLLWEPVAMRKY